MREIDRVRSLSVEELVKYFGIDCSRCGKCKSAEEVDKKSYEDCVKGNVEFFSEPYSLEDLGYECHINLGTDKFYSKYSDKVKRDVEGFVVNYNNTIRKYVRMKNGKLQEHFDRGE